MLFKWFDASDAEKFGVGLAQFFIKKIPLTVARKKNKVIAKQLQTVDLMYLQIEQFKLQSSLNIYKKAKLWSAFKDELKTAGYRPEFVDEITKGLMLKL